MWKQYWRETEDTGPSLVRALNGAFGWQVTNELTTRGGRLLVVRGSRDLPHCSQCTFMKIYQGFYSAAARSCTLRFTERACERVVRANVVASQLQSENLKHWKVPPCV